MNFKIQSVVDDKLHPRYLSSIISRDPNMYNLLENQTCKWEDFSSTEVSTFPQAAEAIQYSGDINRSSVHIPDQSVPPLVFPKVEDMQQWILAAIVLIVLRRLVEKNIFIPLGKRLGIKERPVALNIPCRITAARPELEKSYLSNKKRLSKELIRDLSSKTGLNSREIERWVRKRRALDRPSTLTKFSESGWRFVSYVVSTFMGIRALWDKPWLWDMELLWENFPNHDLRPEMSQCYLYGSGLYISFLITQAFDVKRKDFWEMFVHHIVTILLLTTSWSLNLTRIGMCILLLHDCADVFLELAKMANYLKKQDLSTAIFVIFTLVWIVTRLIIFPSKFIADSAYYMLRIGHISEQVVYSIIGLLTTLFVLHVFWTYFICKVAISAVNSGVEHVWNDFDMDKHKDSRSSTESDASDEIETPPISDSEDQDNYLKKKEKRAMRRLSLQFESGQQLLARINTKQRAIMKRISIEIM